MTSNDVKYRQVKSIKTYDILKKKMYQYVVEKKGLKTTWNSVFLLKIKKKYLRTLIFVF